MSYALGLALASVHAHAHARARAVSEPTVEIFRVESRTNPREGCFRRFDAPAEKARAVALALGVVDPFNHPEPRDEGLYLSAREVCGMPNLDAYRTWFAHPNVRAALYESGTHHMRVYTLPADKVQVGMLQVLFDPDDAVRVRLATPEEMA